MERGRRDARRGLTLLELIITMGITAMLSAIVIAYGSAGRDQTNLSIETIKIAQVIARAKSLAISTQTGGASLCGYGVRFNVSAIPQTYELLSFEKDAITNPDCRDLPAEPATTNVVEKITLNGVLTMGDGADGSAKDDQVLGVYFLPPDPRVFTSRRINTEPAQSVVEAQSGNVYLRTKSGSTSRVITIGGAGQITF